MAINFDSSPVVGQQVSAGNGLVWTWNGNGWDLNANYGQVSNLFVPVSGLIMFAAQGGPEINYTTQQNITYV